MKNVRLGFVGVGGMGQCAHLRSFVGTEGCEVVALAELRLKLGEEVAARYGVPNVYPDHRELLKSETLDGIVAIQPFDLHANLLPDLYAAGIPVLTEKALAASVDAGRGLLQQLKKSKSRHLVAYHKRSDPATMCAVDQIRALANSGLLGNLRYARVTMPPGDWVAGGFADLLRTDEGYPDVPREARPEGVSEEDSKQFIDFVNYYIHQVNLLRHLLGEDYSVSYVDPSGLLLAGRSESGVPCVLEMATYYTTIGWQESALVTFDRGWIRLELPAPMARHRPGRVTIFKDPGDGARPQEVTPDLPWVDAMQQQAVHFVKEIRGEETCLCRADEALKDLEIAQAYVVLLNQVRG